MDWEEVLAYVIECVCGVVITIGIPMIVNYFSKKVNNEKIVGLIDRAGEIVQKCVATIDQVYVDGLKADGKFTKDKQVEAFNMCKCRVINLLNDEAKAAIIDTFGNLDSWIEICIEQAVRDNNFIDVY